MGIVTKFNRLGGTTVVSRDKIIDLLGFEPADIDLSNLSTVGETYFLKTASDIITALGYTPYNSTNPAGYTSNIGTVTSVNNILPDANGNVEIETGGGDEGTTVTVISDENGNLIVEVLPTPLITDDNGNVSLDSELPSIQDITIDQAYNPLSANPQSGVAVASAINTNVSQMINSAISTKADSYIITVQEITNLSDGTIALKNDCSMYKHTPSSATTYVFDTSNLDISSDVAYTFELYINMSTVYAPTFPVSVSWLNSETPDFTATGTYFLAFRTIDGGTTWFGSLQGKW